jgi:hypothetical protein
MERRSPALFSLSTRCVSSRLQGFSDRTNLTLSLKLTLGHVFLAVVIPWDPTGESFDATTLLIGSLMRRVDTDIKAENAERAARGDDLLPELKNAWTMLFFTKNSSRVLGSLVKKRDFLFSDDFFKKYPETDPHHVRIPPSPFCETY